MKSKIVSAILALVIGGLAGYGHVQSVQAQTTRYVVKVVEVEEAKEETNVCIYMDDEIPDEVEIAAYKWGEYYGICPEVLEAIAYFESRYDASVDSKSGTYLGLMQISKKWHSARMEKLGVTDMHDADQNMMVAADYLAELIEKTGSIEDALKRYSGSSTYKYSNKVLNKSMKLEEKHGKE